MASIPITYLAKPGSRLTNEDAGVIGGELYRLTGGHARPFEAVAVVDAARPEAAPLHRYFEWDDVIAAERYRVEQAKHLVRSIEVEVVAGDTSQRARQYHSVTVEAGADEAARAYVPLELVRANGDYLDQVVARARRELASWQQRYQVYRGIGPIVAALDGVGTALSALEAAD